MAVTWLPERSVVCVKEALDQLGLEYSNDDIELRPWTEQLDPSWWHANATIKGRFFVKFAWSKEAAAKVNHEVRVLMTLNAHSPHIRVPRVVAASPALLVTEWVEGEPLTIEHVSQLDNEQLGRTSSELARFLADLHRPEILTAVTHSVGWLPTPMPQASTDAIRRDLAPWIRSDQVGHVAQWCDWTDAVLSAPAPVVLVQGDLHGHNCLWDRRTQTLQAVVDYGESGPGDPAYDFRYLPAQGPTTDLFRATVDQYDQLGSDVVPLTRVVAWHMRTVLGDALWRSRAGVPLPDFRTPAEWVDDMAGRLKELQIVI
jgi:aminoglycoside phosphotransferase (APT) family kinase protein